MRCFPPLAAALLFTLPLTAQVKQNGVWTDPNDESLPPAFSLQGEYVGEVEGGGKIGCQVIATSEDALQAVMLQGGLPGDGWDEKTKILLNGRVDEGKAAMTPAEGEKKYMDGNPDRFSATSKFPPAGHRPWSGVIEEYQFTGETDEGKKFKLKQIVRISPTLGAKPPEGAVLLFDGKSLKHWSGGRLDNGVLHTDAQNVKSNGTFKSYTIHVEFMLPFCPKKRGQGRGNSGFYQVNGMEVQVLDSFGLDGLKNECGALYGRAAPRINMCYPPLTWQTYDVELKPATESKENAGRLTVRHNGVVIHENIACSLREGSFNLQGHGNLLQYQNIWLVEAE